MRDRLGPIQVEAVARRSHRQRLTVCGLVQGVGFRPFAHALAVELQLTGSVRNTASGVVIEIEGSRHALDAFVLRVRTEAPPLAVVEAVECEDVDAVGDTEFRIVDTADGGGHTLVAPDMATCADCLVELGDPTNRRYRHAFISCTNCGPRFTVITGLPYDRPSTTMAALPLCERCASEYGDPSDRRFHAQTVACRDCGPTLRLVAPGLDEVTGDDAVRTARHLLAAGEIVAVKGIGGYHLACDAANEAAVAHLRKRKDRGDKPFAVMVADPAGAEELVEIDELARSALDDARRPVVILPRRSDAAVAPSVAPDQPDLGVVLPYTPLHHLLFGLGDDAPGPRVLVMTSGNVSGEPIVTRDDDALVRLAGLADAWLMHDRPIHVPCDDSVVRIVGEQVLPIRRSRGWAPMPVALPISVSAALATGGDVKNTFCVGAGRRAWLSAHVGDMDDLSTLQAFETATEHLIELTGVRPVRVVADAHPAYRSARWARDSGLATRTVQHHHAHIASVLADAGHDGRSPVIGFAFDGTGFGTDGAVWGGEVLVADYRQFERVAHLSYVPLPGGDAGVRHPCRMALAHLHAAGVAWDERLPSVVACSAAEKTIVRHQLETGFLCTPTSSMGRLFDAVSSLAGVCHHTDYEAEAAMRFEVLAATAGDSCDGAYRFSVREGTIDPGPVIASVAADVLAGVPATDIAARFHHAVCDAVVACASDVRAATGLHEVALSGGVFLNAVLTRLCVRALKGAGFAVLVHRQVPPSDAGLSLGQLVVGAYINGIDREAEPTCA